MAQESPIFESQWKEEEYHNTLGNKENPIIIKDVPPQIINLVEEDEKQEPIYIAEYNDPISDKINKNSNSTDFKLDGSLNYNCLFNNLMHFEQLFTELKQFSKWLKYNTPAILVTNCEILSRIQDITKYNCRITEYLYLLVNSCDLVSEITNIIDNFPKEDLHYKDERIFYLNLVQFRLNIAILCRSCLDYENDYNAFWAWQTLYQFYDMCDFTFTAWNKYLHGLKDKYNKDLDYKKINNY